MKIETTLRNARPLAAQIQALLAGRDSEDAMTAMIVALAQAIYLARPPERRVISYRAACQMVGHQLQALELSAGNAHHVAT